MIHNYNHNLCAEIDSSTPWIDVKQFILCDDTA